MALDFPTRYPEYLVAAIVIILAPGPSVLFIIARAIAWGRATAVATAAGNVTGALTLSLMVAFGLDQSCKEVRRRSSVYKYLVVSI